MEPLESEKNIKYETVFEVWVEGSLGVHAHQPILHSVHESEPAARVYMKEFLEKANLLPSNKFAAPLVQAYMMACVKL